MYNRIDDILSTFTLNRSRLLGHTVLVVIVNFLFLNKIFLELNIPSADNTTTYYISGCILAVDKTHFGVKHVIRVFLRGGSSYREESRLIFS